MTDKEKMLNALKFGVDSVSSRLYTFSLSDFMKTDENGITFLEYACECKVKFNAFTNVGKEILGNAEALYICAKNNNFDWVEGFHDENVFFEKIEAEGGKTLLEYILTNKNKLSYLFFSYFNDRLEVVDYIVQYHKDKIKDISKPLVRELIRPREDGSYLIDKYISNDDFKRLICKKGESYLLFDYCKNRNNYEILKYCDEEKMLSNFKDNKKLYIFLLDNNIDPLFDRYAFKSKEIMNTLIERNRYDLLYNASIELIMEEYETGKTYFDLMIEKQLQGVNVHLEQAPYSRYQRVDLTAIMLIKLAQNDLQGFFPQIDKDFLLTKGRDKDKTILERLIELDRDLTISKILPICRHRRDDDFALILKMLGIEDVDMNIKTEDDSYTDKFTNKCNSTYSNDCISVCPELLDELKELFYNDGKSDKNIIDNLVSSYKYLTRVSSPSSQIFKIELEQLLNVKKNNYSTFNYIKDKGSFFNGSGVSINDSFISTLNHETSHALHFYLGNDYIPDNYQEVIDRARSNPIIIKKVMAYHKTFVDITNKIKSSISDDSIKEFYDNLYQGEKKEQILAFLSSTKEDKIVEFSGSYDESVLNVVLDGSYSFDEFIKQKINEEKEHMANAFFRINYNAIVAISDIIDAIFQGKFFNGVVYDEDNQMINGKHYGHGIDYFERISGFKEMIADYGEIIKSNHGDGMIQYLRCIVGDEVVDMIKDVYENQILNSKVYMTDNEKEEVSNAR